MAGLIGVAVSLTRAYWLVVVFTPMFFWLFVRRKAFLVALGAILVSFVLTIGMSTTWSGVFSDARVDFSETRGVNRVLNFDHWRQSMDGRIRYMYRPSLDAFLEKPLFGNGLMVHKGMATTTHNFHLEWLESGGMFGYLAFAAGYLLHFAHLSRDRNATDTLQVSIGLATLALLLSGLTNGVMHSLIPICAMINFALASACASARKNDERVLSSGALMHRNHPLALSKYRP
jgi:O-antigen ligase